MNFIAVSMTSVSVALALEIRRELLVRAAKLTTTQVTLVSIIIEELRRGHAQNLSLLRGVKND